MSISSDVKYELGYGWAARVTRIDDSGGKESAVRFCLTRWGARRYAQRLERKLYRIEKRGDLR